MSQNNSFFTLFSNINNGFIKKHEMVRQKKSNKILKFLKILLNEGIIRSYRLPKNDPKFVYIFLRISNSALIKLVYISKPSRQVYIKQKNLIKKNGLFILSTSQGFLTNQNAKLQQIGGELICQILF